MRVLFVAAEGLPFSKTGGLADVIEALPKALVAQGHRVAVVLPRYRGTECKKIILRGLAVPIGKAVRSPVIAEGPQLHGVQYFFVDDPEYFDRAQIYGEDGKDYPDNGERFSEFCRAAIELASQVWTPDVFHCHDWHTGLVPVLLHTVFKSDRKLREVPVVFTIHNMGYHGSFPKELLAEIGLPESLFRPEALEFYGKLNFLKGGLVYSDFLTTVSPKYAQEIQTPEYGHGLDGVVRGRADRLTGILNGVDYSVWSPEIDGLTAARYSAKDFKGKEACKTDLLQEFGLAEENAGRPVIGIVSRFADQKGFDLLAEVADELLQEDLAMVALGSGEPTYEMLFHDLEERHPERVAVKIAYDNPLAHKIEAGADMFLMPSRYEPCGLNQIYSLRYGTVPIVRATGGLDDTIEAFDPEAGPAPGRGTGFKFQEYTGEALLESVRQALTMFEDKAAWRRLQINGMAKDFSWNASAAEYGRLYEVARKTRIRRGAGSSN
jgi:starch synthase